MKLLLDMNLSPRWRNVLIAADFVVDHWSEIGAHNASDSDIMRHALSSGSIVLTHDLDFGAILAATGGAKPSVVQLRADDTSPEANAERLIAALRQCEAELREGALLTVNPARVRITLLPLQKHG